MTRDHIPPKAFSPNRSQKTSKWFRAALTGIVIPFNEGIILRWQKCQADTQSFYLFPISVRVSKICPTHDINGVTARLLDFYP
jgi:hypothetical protein